MTTYWHHHYKDAARQFPITEGHADLSVGFKITNIDGTTHGGYYWRQVNALHDEPILHKASAWDPTNHGSCPRAPGDGLCVALSISAATSGGVKLTECIGHVLVYSPTVAQADDPGKLRVPWVIDVDCFNVIEVVRGGFVADLRNADLRDADLRNADLRYASLQGANLQGAHLQYADLQYASLLGADLQGANLWRSVRNDEVPA
jgi:hypothetical protein